MPGRTALAQIDSLRDSADLSISTLPVRPSGERRFAVRFMMIVKADKRTEAGVMPTAQELENMGKYNEELIKAGVLIDAAGLQPTTERDPEVELRQFFELEDFPNVPADVAEMEKNFGRGAQTKP